MKSKADYEWRIVRIWTVAVMGCFDVLNHNWSWETKEILKNLRLVSHKSKCEPTMYLEQSTYYEVPINIPCSYDTNQQRL